MSGESVPLGMALPRFAACTSEATKLYRELRKPLLRYLVCMGLSADEAQDVVQDAFVSLQRHLAAGGSQANVRSWLYRVAHNSARNRQTSYERRFAARLEGEVEKMIDLATPEQAMLEKEKFRRLGEEIRLLGGLERECLLLRGGGLRYRAIARSGRFWAWPLRRWEIPSSGPSGN